MYLLLKKLMKQHSLRGGGLIYGLGVLTVISIIFTGLIIFVVSHVRYSLTAQPREAALHVAEAGLYTYRWYVAGELDGKTAGEVTDFWTSTTEPPLGSAGPDGVCGTADDDGGSAGADAICGTADDQVGSFGPDGVCGTADDGRYEKDYDARGVQGTYSLCAVVPADGDSSAYVESIGWTDKKPDKKRTVRMRLRRPSWSEFAILANAPIEIPVGTTVEGGVHSNNGIRVEGPVTGLVSSSVSTYEYTPGVTRDGVWTNTTPESSVFLQGTSFPTPVQDFNSVVTSFTQIQAASNAQFSIPTKAGGQGWHLVFKDDGTADLYWVKKYNDATKELSYKDKDHVFEQTLTLGDTNAIYARNDLWIEGVIDSGKQVTIAAHHSGNGRNHSVYINGDIVYEDDVSGTILGIAAERDIEVIADPGTGSDTTLDIHAALLAQTGRVGRSAYAGAPLSRVNVVGAIATFQDYGFEKTTNVDIEYDKNFIFNAPPYFPTGGSYVIDEWSELE